MFRHPTILKGEMDAVNALAEINADVRAPCPTRWCYQFERFASAATVTKTMESRHQFGRAAAALQPFRVAIDKVQRDDATLFSCLAIWERLLRTVDKW